MMELVNGMYKYKELGIGASAISVEPKQELGGVWAECLRTIPKLLSPYAPHFAEEMWERIGGSGLVMQQAWPVFDPGMVKESVVTIVVQVNGRVRDKLEVSADTDMKIAQEMALQLPKIQSYVDGKQVRKVVTVPQKLINIVVS
jgi:leucyl-tRNA synthetase